MTIGDRMVAGTSAPSRIIGIIPEDYWVPAFLVGAVILGAISRLLIFGDALVFDEGSTHFVVTERSFDEMIGYVRGEQEVTPPLFFIFAWVAQQLDDTPEMLRLVSLIAGLATIPLTYVLGKMTVGRNPALVASLLISISPFMSAYSAEARPYSLLILAVLVSSIVLIKALQENRVGWWILFAVACAATMYTHYTGLFVLAGQFAWALVFFAERRRNLLLAGFGAAVLYLPWLSEYRADSNSPGAEVIGSIIPFEFENVPRTLGGWAYGHPVEDLAAIPGPVLEISLAVGVLIGLTGLIMKASSENNLIPDRLALLPVVLALSTPLGTVLFSTFSVSVFLERNQAASSVGLALIIGAIVMAPARRSLRCAAAGLVIAAVSISLILTLDRDDRRLDYQGALEYVTERAPEQAVIVEASDAVPAPASAVDIVKGQKGIDIPVLRLGRPSAEDLAALLAPGGSGRYSELPSPTVESVAEKSLSLAGGGEIFLIARSFGRFGGASVFAPELAEFQDALGRRAKLVDETKFPGVPDGLTVWTYRSTKEESTREMVSKSGN